METVSVVLSMIGLAAFIVSLLVKGKKMKVILALTVAGNLLMAVSYMLTGNYNGCVSSVVGMLVGLINYFFAVQEKKIPKWLLGVYALAFVSVNLAVLSSWRDIFAIGACLAAVLMISASSGKGYRIWCLANDLLWTVFDLLCGNFGPLVTHGVLTGFTIIGMLLHDREKKVEKTEQA